MATKYNRIDSVELLRACNRMRDYSPLAYHLNRNLQIRFINNFIAICDDIEHGDRFSNIPKNIEQPSAPTADFSMMVTLDENPANNIGYTVNPSAAAWYLWPMPTVGAARANGNNISFRIKYSANTPFRVRITSLYCRDVGVINSIAGQSSGLFVRNNNARYSMPQPVTLSGSHGQPDEWVLDISFNLAFYESIPDSKQIEIAVINELTPDATPNIKTRPTHCALADEQAYDVDAKSSYVTIQSLGAEPGGMTDDARIECLRLWVSNSKRCAYVRRYRFPPPSRHIIMSHLTNYTGITAVGGIADIMKPFHNVYVPIPNRTPDGAVRYRGYGWFMQWPPQLDAISRATYSRTVSWPCRKHTDGIGHTTAFNGVDKGFIFYNISSLMGGALTKINVARAPEKRGSTWRAPASMDNAVDVVIGNRFADGSFRPITAKNIINGRITIPSGRRHVTVETLIPVLSDIPLYWKTEDEVSVSALYTPVGWASRVPLNDGDEGFMFPHELIERLQTALG